MKPAYIAARVAELQSGGLMIVGASTLNLPWCALGFVLYMTSGWLVQRAFAS
jgi:hypothetical protein